MAYAELIPEAVSLGSKLLGSTVGRMAAKTVATKAVGAVASKVTGGGGGGGGAGGGGGVPTSIGQAAVGALNNIHPISNSAPGTQPMGEPGYNNLSQAQFGNSV